MAIHTTAILNLKGGVGKTTTAVNVAAILARDHQKRVLVVDADAQCNTTEFFGGDPSRGNLADLLRNGSINIAADLRDGLYIQRTKYENVDLLPADESLMDLDLSKVEQRALNAKILRYLVDARRNRYDVVLVDCPPAFNAACAAALIAADDVIIPIKLDAFSLRGMANLMRQIKNMRKINPRLKLAGCLPTMWYNNQQIRDAESQIKAAGLPLFSHIRRSDKVDKMTFAQEPLLISSPNSAAGVDYRKFVGEYLQMGGM